MESISPALVVGFIVVLYLVSSIKILAEYERGVIFRLGKLLPQPKGPGLALVFAPIDRMVKVSLRTVVLDVPPQDVITKDNVSVKVNAGSSRSKISTTQRHSSRKRHSVASLDRWSWTICCRSASD
jgi:regulator of protease activity HflC (stomatin/prohibitin superfamily)